MKVLLLSVDFPPHRDGVSTLSYHYARRLAERGHDVLVVGPRSGGDRELDRSSPFRVWRFPGYGLGVARFFPFMSWAKAAMMCFRPDIVLPMNVGYGGLLCLVLRPFLRRRYITFAYAYEFLKVRANPILHRLYRRIYARGEFTVAISQFTKSRLVEFGVPEDAIRIIHPGVAPALSNTSRSGGAVPAIGTCGRLIRRKGHDLVIRALPAVLEEVPGVVYRIAGDGPERHRFEKLANELGVSNHVEFLGRLPEEELPRFYRELDVFVMPGRDDGQSGHVEGFGIVYLEAAIQGVPSIGTQTGGIPEAIGETGLIVPPDSPTALADAIIDLLTNADRRRQLGHRARERALADFGWDRQVDRLHEWLETAVLRRRPDLQSGPSQD